MAAYNRLAGSRSESPVLLVRLPKRLLMSLKAEARARGVKVSQLAREALEAFARRIEKKRK